MDRPAIVIRDIHHYGDDLTVPEAAARLRDGGPVTVTVTGPAPPGGDPRGNPRYGSGITVQPAPGGQPELPPEISWEARSSETPDSAALFAGALALASQLAACAGPASGQSALARAAAAGDRGALEHTGDPGTRLRPGDEGTVTAASLGANTSRIGHFCYLCSSRKGLMPIHRATGVVHAVAKQPRRPPRQPQRAIRRRPQLAPAHA